MSRKRRHAHDECDRLTERIRSIVKHKSDNHLKGTEGCVRGATVEALTNKSDTCQSRIGNANIVTYSGAGA